MSHDDVVEVRLDAYASIDRAALSPGQVSTIKRAFRHRNPQFNKMRAMGYRPVNEPQAYDCSFERDGRLYVWRGGARRLRELLESYDLRVKWKDARTKLPPAGLTFGELVPHPEQERAATELQRAQQGLLRGHTGSGKTETLLTAAIKLDQPTIVVVWNKDLLKQWMLRITEKYKILKPRQVGVIQGERNSYGPITLAMAQTLTKRTDEWADRFGTLLYDECQRAPANSFINCVLPFSARHRFGGTADEKRRDGKEFLAYEAFGYEESTERKASIKFEPVAEIEGLGQALEPTIVVIPTKYEDAEYEETRSYTHFITRLVGDQARNTLIGRHLREQLEAGRQVILFTERTEAARMWVEVVADWGYSAGPLIGGAESAEETSATIALMQKGKVRFGATTTYADVGLDIPSLDCAFVTCPTAKNIKRMNQQVGRIVRPLEGKPTPLAFYFWDRHIAGISGGISKIKSRWDNVVVRD